MEWYMKKSVFLIIIFFAVGNILFAQSSFVKGEELFLQNKPSDALPFLEQAVAEDPAHVQAALYLGIAYQQVNKFDEAIAVYRKILPRAGNQSALIAFNLGNVYFSRGNAAFAEQYYNEAISADPVYASAYLNRANSRIKSGMLQESIADYEQYLSLEPASPKRRQIESLIAFIRNEEAAAEQQKLMAEAAAKAEAERRQRLLDDVSASLQAGATDAEGLSSGAENVQGYEGEFELE
jgi:tetratricopeptide (TPR) repeat protein